VWYVPYHDILAPASAPARQSTSRTKNDAIYKAERERGREEDRECNHFTLFFALLGGLHRLFFKSIYKNTITSQLQSSDNKSSV
jgi:hypothetical protein